MNSPTKAQLDSLESLTKWLDKEYGIDEVGKHNDYNDTQIAYKTVDIREAKGRGLC